MYVDVRIVLQPTDIMAICVSIVSMMLLLFGIVVCVSVDNVL